MFLLPNLVVWLAHLKVVTVLMLDGGCDCGDDDDDCDVDDGDDHDCHFVVMHQQDSLKDMHRQYGKKRSMGIFGYCVL